jgi:hypothetical protein
MDPDLLPILGVLIPILGILTGIIVPVAVFIWLYKDAKNERETIIEISKNLDDPEQIEKLMGLLKEKNKEPIDYRRSGVITIGVGLGLYLFGLMALGPVLKGVGLLVGAIGIGTMVAGYLFPKESEELTSAVDAFEKK